MTTIGALIAKRRASTLVCLAWAACFAPAVHSAEPRHECLAVEQAFASNELATLEGLQLTEPRWQALQQFRLAAIYIPKKEHGAARKAVRTGLRVVKRGLREDKDDVELLLLGAMLDGQYLLVDRWRFFYNGVRGLRRLGHAERIDSTNPRARLIRGTAKVVLPGVLGGGASEAVNLLNAGLSHEGDDGQSFQSTPLCHHGEWAQVDILNWLGRAYAKLGNDELAANAYRQALERSPDNHWVKLAIAGQGYEWQDASPSN